jgi:cellulose synthase/poly-beta-1,6-N-acetylglucosamine synthase-like glycosyltransferase
VLSPIITDCYATGVLPELPYRTLIQFFPNCNLAVRKAALARAGYYDEQCIASEDVDMCKRVANQGWWLFYEPQAACGHEPRRTLGALMRQWFWYGRAAAFVFQKHQSERFEIFVSLDPRPRIFSYRRIVALKRSPVQGLLFLNYFTILLGLALLLGFSLVLGAWTVSWMMGAALVAGAAFVHLGNPVLRGRSLREKTIYYLVGVLINAACTAGGLVGGLRRGMVYIHPGV